jgi:hypothetical protein
MHNTSHAIKKSKQVMLDPYALYALGFALLQIQAMLLKTWCLWTTGNLLFHLPLLRKEPTNDGSYILIKQFD